MRINLNRFEMEQEEKKQKIDENDNNQEKGGRESAHDFFIG